jgi:hypothetical protein
VPVLTTGLDSILTFTIIDAPIRRSIIAPRSTVRHQLDTTLLEFNALDLLHGGALHNFRKKERGFPLEVMKRFLIALRIGIFL